MIKIKSSNILNKVNKNHYLLRLLLLIISCFIFAFSYNAFLVPNNIVTGGVSGLAIIIKELTGLPVSYFIYGATSFLIIIFYIIFGKEKTINTIIGSIIYMFMVSLTEPLAKNLNITFESNTILILITGILQGVSNGMIYRGGFNTGGTDIIATILVKFIKMPVGAALRIINTIIIGVGAIIFGFTNAIYAILILLISSKLVDIVMLGINDSKMVFIKSERWKFLESNLNYKYKLGVTEMGNLGGIFRKKDPVLFITVPYHIYNDLKEEVIKEDPNAFISSLDCYMVLGGYKNKIIPF